MMNSLDQFWLHFLPHSQTHKLQGEIAIEKRSIARRDLYFGHLGQTLTLNILQYPSRTSQSWPERSPSQNHPIRHHQSLLQRKPQLHVRLPEKRETWPTQTPTTCVITMDRSVFGCTGSICGLGCICWILPNKCSFTSSFGFLSVCHCYISLSFGVVSRKDYGRLPASAGVVKKIPLETKLWNFNREIYMFLDVAKLHVTVPTETIDNDINMFHKS